MALPTTGQKFSGQTAAVVGDLTATTAILPVSINVTTVPLSRKLTLGVLRDFLASAATGFAAVAVTALALNVLPAGATNGVRIGQDVNAPTYGLITFSNVFDETDPNFMGIEGGGAGDNGLYFGVPAGGFYSYDLGGPEVFGYGASGARQYVQFHDTLLSDTAVATHAALTGAAATPLLVTFASAVSGAALMGFGSTHDVALKNRAGTTALGVTANTTDVTVAAKLTVGGVLKLGNARVAGVVVQGGTVTMQDSTGTPITVLTT